MQLVAADATSSAARRSLRRALLRWYDANRRALPWRETRDPYRIWVSEIMLQQTRVAAVVDHYRTFFERFPTVQKLAAASEDTVLAAWSGLGYYRRARMLLRCAQQVVRAHGGRFPATAAELRELPGIGRYTAAAIASIAFGETAAVVDGNVERVLRRLCGHSRTTAATWELAQSLLEKSRPGDFNQAMMELGATVCLPRSPMCGDCPARQWCKTKGEERRKKVTVRQMRTETWRLLEERDGRVRLVQRPQEDSLMAGMWELPQLGRVDDPTNSAHKKSNYEAWRTFRHSITTTDYKVHVVRQNGTGRSGSRSAACGKWIATADLPHMPLTGLTRKVLRAASII